MLMNELVAMSIKGLMLDPVSNSPIVAWTELEIASPPGNLEHSLRLFASWLVSAAREGPPDASPCGPRRREPRR